MARARWTALAVVAALVALAAGVVGCGSSQHGTDVRKVAFVAPYSDNELDWTLQAQEVIAEWPRHLGVRVDKADASQTDDVRGVLEQVSHEGNQLVIAHDSRYAEAAEAVARETRVPELVWGERPDAPKGLVGQIHVQDKESGYAAGVVAAHSAITARLGIIVLADGSEWDLRTWNRTAGGFIAGARSIYPHEWVSFEQIGENGSATPQQVYDATVRMQRRGAQMIFALGGSSAIGALRAVERIGGEEQYIGVIGDKSRYNRENYMLESIIWDTRPVFRQAVRDLRAGRFAEHPYELTFANRGLWLFRTGRTPNDAYDAGIAAQQKIERGKIKVPVTSTRAAIEALIANRTPQG